MKKPGVRHICLLVPPHIEYNQQDRSNPRGNDSGKLPRFRSRRTVALLGYLVVERRPVAREHLAALFWPDEATSDGRSNLSRELHNLNRILPECWELDRRSVTFVPSPDTTVDIYVLLNFIEQERWLEAAELLGGEFLEGIYLPDNPEFENWLLGERERWRTCAEEILARTIESQKLRGRYSDALRLNQRLLQLAPWNEQAHRGAMRLLAWTGNRAAALRQFDICTQALGDELAVEPAPETKALYKEIQAGKIDLPPQLPAFLTEEKARRNFEQPLFFGRESELVQLDAHLRATLEGKGGVVFITGGPGRGKTALLDAFTRRAMDNHPNLLVARGKCNAYSGLGDPYLPFRDILTMLTGDVESRWDTGAISLDHAQRLWAAFPFIVQVILDHGPNLLGVLVPSAALLSRAMAVGQDYAPWISQLKKLIKRDHSSRQDLEQSHLFQQVNDVLRIVSNEQPLLLIMDDIQWADTASISLLFHLGKRLPDLESRLLIACAYRPEELALDRNGERHALAKALSEFKRSFGNVWINIGDLEETEGRKFVGELIDAEPNRLTAGFRDTLYHRTKGHPLFTVELLRDLQERGDLLKDKDGFWIEGSKLDWDFLPARAEAVIEERIDKLTPNLQEILTIASVEGEVFTANVMALVLNVPERIMLYQLLQELERKYRLVKEQEEIETSQNRLSRYRFNHILFQNYIYKRLTPEHKRLLHMDVAVALEKLYEGQLDEVAVRLAQHFHQAGDYEKALNYYGLAGERAACMYASGEAVAHFTSAIQLTSRVSTDAASIAGFHRGRGLAYGIVGDFERARLDHEYALQVANSARENQLEWRTLIDLGRLWASRDYIQALDYFEAALGVARRTGEPAFLAGSLNWLGNWCANDDNPKQAVKHHQEALKIFQDLRDRREMANTLDLLGLAHLLGGDLGESIRNYDRAVAISRDLEDHPRLASSLVGRATTVSVLVYLASVSTRPSPDAMKDIHEAMRIAGEFNLASDETWAYWSLGQLCIVHGKFGHALNNIYRGLRIASEIGHREWVVGNRFALGILYNELFSPEQAKEQLERALSLADELHSPTWIHLLRGALAGAYFLGNDLKSAEACLELAALPQTTMDTLGKRYCWVRQAELAVLQKKFELALEITNCLIDTAPGMTPDSVITFLWKLKGELMAAFGRLEEAHTLLLAALENARVNEEHFLLWRIHISLGKLCGTMGQQDEARKEFSAAREEIEQRVETIDDEELKSNFLNGAYRALGESQEIGD